MGRSPLKEPNSLTFGRVKIMPTLLFYQALYTTIPHLPPLKKEGKARSFSGLPTGRYPPTHQRPFLEYSRGTPL